MRPSHASPRIAAGCTVLALAAALAPARAGAAQGVAPVPAAPADADAERGRRLKAAIDAAHAWLTAHQDDDGRFSASTFVVHDPRGAPTSGPGKPDQDVYVTSLVVKSCYGVASLPNRGEHQAMVGKGLDWLARQQRDDGWLCDPSLPFGLRNHVLACNVLESGGNYAGRDDYRTAARRGAERARALLRADGTLPHTARAATERAAGVGSAGPADSETTAWLEGIAGGDGPAGSLAMLAGPDPEQLARLDLAAALYSLTWHGGRDAAQWTDGRDALVAVLPGPGRATDAGADRDPRVWYFGAQTVQFAPPEVWRRWSDALVAAALPLQRDDGSFAGSWDPDCAHGDVGGRIYATAMTTLALEVVWRKDHRDR